ncbi:MAG: hypothetical protein JXB32_08305, partial [Deltaproteobacteria bacterium]|nr:hypothetical protein [Deltaproteobacteria bacterium]
MRANPRTTRGRFRFLPAAAWVAAGLTAVAVASGARAQEGEAEAVRAGPEGAAAEDAAGRTEDGGEADEPDGPDEARPATFDGAAATSYETVVVGARHPEDPFRSDRAVTTVGSQELAERAPRTAPEALWESPGVFVQQTN